MKSVILEVPPLVLSGFDFFGDPFRSHGGWSEENEIGRLWTRWMVYLEQTRHLFQIVKETDVMYEVHIYHTETPKTGEFEVFVGIEITRLEGVPPEVVIKRMPAGRYAIFTLIGEEITADWTWQLDSEWLPALGVRRCTAFSIQRYDARFKGMEAIADSELDVYIPLLDEDGSTDSDR
ncbi:MAG: GyrI-like domain-containing protein [Anaerolineae bacterium]|nr:GyrI-like domain-containing protein [Anaerolineae bacterium]